MIKEKTGHKRSGKQRISVGNRVYQLDKNQKIDMSQSFMVIERDENLNVLLSNGDVVPSWSLCRWVGNEAR